MDVALREVMWHGEWLYSVHTQHTETAAVSRGTSHVTTKQCCKYTTWLDIRNALKKFQTLIENHRVQELCESRGGRPGLSVLMSLTVSVDIKQHWTMLIGTGHSLFLICQPTSEDMKLYVTIGHFKSSAWAWLFNIFTCFLRKMTLC